MTTTASRPGTRRMLANAVSTSAYTRVGSFADRPAGSSQPLGPPVLLQRMGMPMIPFDDIDPLRIGAVEVLAVVFSWLRALPGAVRQLSN